MKESGINYFYSQLGLDTGFFGILYTFEEGAGTTINSVPSGQSAYTGTLASSAGFWVKPGSGFANGASISVANASGLASTSWTQVFVYEKVNANPAVLFSSAGGGSGYSLGLNSANKAYMEGFNREPIVAAGYNNLGSKNALSIAYQPNQVTFGLYNMTSQSIEAESYTAPFELVQSDAWRLAPSYTGWLDYYLYLTTYLSPEVIGGLLSGLYARPTGTAYDTQTICVTGVTGYSVAVGGLTGTTGYVITPGGDEGRDYFTGAFPTTHTQTALTGYLSSGLIYTPLTGVVCQTTTGGQVDLLEYLTGYAAGFGMDKIQLFSYVETRDYVKTSASMTPFDNAYNINGIANYSGFLFAASYPTGAISLYWNGLGQGGSGWYESGAFVFVTGTETTDAIWLDLKEGQRRTATVSGALSTFPIPYSGQELYLNGINLISGLDFRAVGAQVMLTGTNTGVSGILFEYPTILPYTTGNTALWTGVRFWRDTSNEYFNGVRQQKDALYIEGCLFDMLSGNAYNPAGAFVIYDNNNLYWT